MIKRILPIILCLCLIFGINAMALNPDYDTNADTPAVSEEIPVQEEGRMHGGPGDMAGHHPDGENAPDDKVPDMPNGDMMPPEGVENGEKNKFPNESLGMGDEIVNDDIKNNNENTEKISEEQNGIIEFIKTYSTPVISVILLMFAFIFVKFYKRKNY